VGRDRRGVLILDERARGDLSPAARHSGILGTAVNVQAMVFGNMGDTSATGVAFTRNPSTGESRLYGEFLIKRPGRGTWWRRIRTPQDITE